MRFLIDEQLPRTLAHWLAERGHEARHVDDVGLSGHEDRSIWNHAAASGAVIVTKDEDFIRVVVDSNSGPSVVWVRLGNVRPQNLLGRFGGSIELLVEALKRGERIVELR